MENRSSLMLVVLLSAILVAACGPSQAELDAQETKVAAAIFATQTAQAPTATPTPTPTDTPTPSPTPTPTDTPVPSPTTLPDLSDVVLTLDDLPSGFSDMPLEQLGLTPEDLSGGGFEAESVFAFLEPSAFQLIMGFTLLVPDAIQQAGFDLALRNPEFLLNLFVSGMGATEVVEQQELPGLDDVGDVSTGLTVVADLGGISMRIDMVVFRTGPAGAIVMLMYPDGADPDISIGEVAQRLESRLTEALSSGK